MLHIGNVQFDQRVNPCKASVVETNGAFQTGRLAHNHQVEAGTFTATQVMASVKTKALRDKLRPASPIVEEVHILIQPNK